MIEILLEAERHLSHGRLDQAEHLYRQAANADPRNSIAVVGLARVAIERADDARALELAERALAIDAENEAARRMADRLREVARYRGTPEAAGPSPGEAPATGRVETAATEADLATAPTGREPAAPEPEAAVVPSPEPVVPDRGPVALGAGPATAEDVAGPQPASAAPEAASAGLLGRVLGWLRRLFGRR